MDAYTFQFGQMEVTMPWWWLWALAGWLAAIGLILFFLGQRLVKPTSAIIGLVTGAVLTLVVLKTQWPETTAMPWVIAAALVFGVLFLVLWRIWVAVVFSDFIAVVAPILLLAVSGIGAPPVHTTIATTLTKIADAAGIETEVEASDEESEGSETATEADDDDAKEDVELEADPAEIGEIIVQGVEETRTVAYDWWNELEPSTRWGLAATSIGGSIVAFVLALALPMFGASMVTAFLGSLMALPGVIIVTRLISPEAALAMTSSPRGLVIGIAVATIIGAFIQWMLLRPSADK